MSTVIHICKRPACVALRQFHSAAIALIPSLPPQAQSVLAALAADPALLPQEPRAQAPKRPAGRAPTQYKITWRGSGHAVTAAGHAGLAQVLGISLNTLRKRMAMLRPHQQLTATLSCPHSGEPDVVEIGTVVAS